MPLFFFHLRSPAGLDRDEIGLDLDGLEIAYLEACASIPNMAADLLKRKAKPSQHSFEIMDAADNLLMEVPFSEVLDRERKPVRPDLHRWHQQAHAQKERSARLIAAVAAEQRALRANLTETKRLLAEARKATGSPV
ncbi:MAG: hypothetical protein K2X00_21015 [Nitrospiraceae bacterium]|nr:hypothetical protein [Nitrospiraceae bacterium]